MISKLAPLDRLTLKSAPRSTARRPTNPAPGDGLRLRCPFAPWLSCKSRLRWCRTARQAPYLSPDCPLHRIGPVPVQALRKLCGSSPYSACGNHIGFRKEPLPLTGDEDNNTQPQGSPCSSEPRSHFFMDLLQLLLS